MRNNENAFIWMNKLFGIHMKTLKQGFNFLRHIPRKNGYFLAIWRDLCYTIGKSNMRKGGLRMISSISYTDAENLLRKYNKESFHLRHAYTVEGVMRYFARTEGYAAEEEFWAIVGLLHDIDFELYPEDHCKKAPELLREGGANEEIIHAVCCHGYGICSDIEPAHPMEKILFAADELTGLIWATAKMRPSHSTVDMELSSLKKKYKDKKFAAGCSRDVIALGAERLGWTLDTLLDKTLCAMRETEAAVNEKCGE